MRVRKSTRSLVETDALLTQVTQDSDKITRRVNATGLTNAVGQLLRKHRADLPSLRPYERSLRLLKDRINSAQLAMMELEDRRAELMKVDVIIVDIIAAIDAGTSEEQRSMIHQAAEEAVVTLRLDTDGLLKEYDRAL